MSGNTVNSRSGTSEASLTNEPLAATPALTGGRVGVAGEKLLTAIMVHSSGVAATFGAAKPSRVAATAGTAVGMETKPNAAAIAGAARELEPKLFAALLHDEIQQARSDGFDNWRDSPHHCERMRRAMANMVSLFEDDTQVGSPIERDVWYATALNQTLTDVDQDDAHIGTLGQFMTAQDLAFLHAESM